jgi:hypothetical protein
MLGASDTLSAQVPMSPTNSLTPCDITTIDPAQRRI